jgi:biopolymer transport protein ExbD
MRRSRPSLSIEEPTINITPLIDVVFVVLIMFILIAPLVDKENVHLAKGSSSEEHELKESSLISLVVKKNSELLLNRIPVDLEDLPYRLKEVKSLYPEATPQLFHDRMAPFGTYQEVKLAMEVAGFSEMELVVEPSTKNE